MAGERRLDAAAAAHPPRNVIAEERIEHLAQGWRQVGQLRERRLPELQDGVYTQRITPRAALSCDPAGVPVAAPDGVRDPRGSASQLFGHIAFDYDEAGETLQSAFPTKQLA